MFMLNSKLLAEAFPINKVEVFFDAEDHSNFLGFQWEMVSQGKMPIGLNTSDTDFNSIGKTGGEKEVTLNVYQMPSHQHDMYEVNPTTAGGSWTPQYNNGGDYQVQLTGALPIQQGYQGLLGQMRSGGDQPHNNMPPYIVMAFWKRIA